MDIAVFGIDHWSVFAYGESCCVDSRGVLEIQRLRVNEIKRGIRSNGSGWRPQWGTKVKGGETPDPNHDDLDCLDDLEAAGLLKQVGDLTNPAIQMTDKGKQVAHALRDHKIDGGQWGTFEYTE